MANVNTFSLRTALEEKMLDHVCCRGNLRHDLVSRGRNLRHDIVRRGRSLGRNLVSHGRSLVHDLVPCGRSLGPDLVRRGRSLGHFCRALTVLIVCYSSRRTFCTESPKKHSKKRDEVARTRRINLHRDQCQWRDLEVTI